MNGEESPATGWSPCSPKYTAATENPETPLSAALTNVSSEYDDAHALLFPLQASRGYIMPAVTQPFNQPPYSVYCSRSSPSGLSSTRMVCPHHRCQKCGKRKVRICESFFLARWRLFTPTLQHMHLRAWQCCRAWAHAMKRCEYPPPQLWRHQVTVHLQVMQVQPLIRKNVPWTTQGTTLHERIRQMGGMSIHEKMALWQRH